MIFADERSVTDSWYKFEFMSYDAVLADQWLQKENVVKQFITEYEGLGKWWFDEDTGDFFFEKECDAMMIFLTFGNDISKVKHD